MTEKRSFGFLDFATWVREQLSEILTMLAGKIDASDFTGGESGQLASATGDPQAPVQWKHPGLVVGAAVPMSEDFIAQANGRYCLMTALTATLPEGSTLQAGAVVTFIKKISVEPKIRTTFGDTISYRDEFDHTVIYDINTEIQFIWTGTHWEI